MTSSYESILYAEDGKVIRITLNRPDKRNSLTPGMLEELNDALRRADEAKDACVVILRGAGDKAFCAGADLGGMGGGRAFWRSMKHAASFPSCSCECFACRSPYWLQSTDIASRADWG